MMILGGLQKIVQIVTNNGGGLCLVTYHRFKYPDSLSNTNIKYLFLATIQILNIYKFRLLTNTKVEYIRSLQSN